MVNGDDILRNKLQEGDVNAFKSLFETYYSQLIAYGMSMTQNMEVSRGLVQDVFLKLWENRTKNIIRGSIKAYLFSAINNQALNWLRHEKVRYAYENTMLKDVMTSVELPPTINPFLAEAIKNAIDDLPEKALRVFTLTQLEGIPQKEVALTLGLSLKTVENHLARSRKILQKRLRKYR